MKKLFILSIMLVSYSLVNAQTIWTSETKFKGTIGDIEIAMTLAVPLGGGSVCAIIGDYSYLSGKKNSSLCSEDGEIIIEEVDGNETGYFILNEWEKNIGQTLVGSWHTMDGLKSHPVNLKVIGKGEN